MESGKLYSLMERYLPDFIYGANDGIVTTLAIVSAVIGAGLSSLAILVLGFANLIADGFSMGASNFLSNRSRPLLERPDKKQALKHGLATFIGFVIAGLMPLLAYLLPGIIENRFFVSVMLGLLTLFIIGAGRSFFTDRHWFWAGTEMFTIGAFASLVAYFVGAIVSRFVNGI